MIMTYFTSKRPIGRHYSLSFGRKCEPLLTTEGSGISEVAKNGWHCVCLAGTLNTPNWLWQGLPVVGQIFSRRQVTEISPTLISKQNYSLAHQFNKKRKKKRSDSVLWQKPLHRQKNPKSNVTTQKRHQKTLITQRLRTDLGRSVGVMKATQLVWLNRFTGSLPSH